MKKSFILLFVVTIFIASCSITQEYHFNKDLSGTSSTTVDVSMLKGFMGGMDSTGSADKTLDSLGLAFAEVSSKLEEAGAKNVKYGWNEDKTILSISYDFSDLDNLNKCLTADNSSDKLLGVMGESSGKISFSGNKKALQYKVPKKSVMDSTLNTTEMQSMKDYYKYSLILSFDQKIKSIDNKAATISEDGKKVTMNCSLLDLASPTFNSDILVKLKKK